MIELLMIIISLVLVAACGVFVAAEFALVTVDRNKIDRLATRGDTQATGVQRALRTLSTQLSGAQIGITLTNLAIGFLAEPAIAHLIESPLETIGLSGVVVTTISMALALFIATVLTMLFGELVPKNLAIAQPVKTAKLVQSIQRNFSSLMYPAIVLTNGTANAIVRKFGIQPQEELASARSVEELLAVVKHSAKRGTIENDSAVLLERSFAFSERHASDVMTPRVKLEVVHKGEKVAKVIELVKETGYSRFPVVDGEIDNIIGFVHLREAVTIEYDRRTKVLVEDIMKPALFAPSSIEIDALIEKMRQDSTEVVMTIDEYGGIDGIVTLEDLIEELVGEVKDEHDDTGVDIRRIKKNSWSVSGLLRSDEVGQELKITLPQDEEFETIGGLVMDLMESVPEVGDEVSVNALKRSGQPITVLLKVVAMDGRRVDRINVSIQRYKEVADV